MFNKVSTTKLITNCTFGIAGLILTMFTIGKLSYAKGRTDGAEMAIDNMPIEEKYHIITSVERNSFSQEALVQMLKDLNVKFPHIVLAQSIIESGHFKSHIFRANHNLFGMKQARVRCTTADGTNLGHAYYDNWRESVYDYAFFQSAYLRNLKTEAQYLEYLDKNYAEANDYDVAVMRVVEKEDLKSLFE